MGTNAKDLHDFNNYLAIILGFCDLLLEETPPADPRRRDLEEIHKAATAARHLVARLFPSSEQAPR